MLKGTAVALASAASQDILIAHWQGIVNNIGCFLNMLKSNNVSPLSLTSQKYHTTFIWFLYYTILLLFLHVIALHFEGIAMSSKYKEKKNSKYDVVVEINESRMIYNTQTKESSLMFFCISYYYYAKKTLPFCPCRCHRFWFAKSSHRYFLSSMYNYSTGSDTIIFHYVTCPVYLHDQNLIHLIFLLICILAVFCWDENAALSVMENM